MALKPNQLWIVVRASELADMIRREVICWSAIHKNTLGYQLIRSADSVGANIVEGYGRYHNQDALRFYFYARGSLEETMYWIKRACAGSIVQHIVSKHWLERYLLLSRGLEKFIVSQGREQSRIVPK